MKYKRMRIAAGALLAMLWLTACTSAGTEWTTGAESVAQNTSQEQITGEEQTEWTTGTEPVAQTEAPSTEAEPIGFTIEEQREVASPADDQPYMFFYQVDADTSQYRRESYMANYSWTDYTNYVDIVEYVVFASNECDTIDYAGYREAFQTWWDACPEHATTEIGYEVILNMKDGTRKIATLLGPEDTASIFSYVEVYLYDDMNHDYGEWYSHVTVKEPGVLLTGIKLTPGEHVDEVEGIVLTVFTYQSDADFDAASGRYHRGNCETVFIYNASEGTGE